METLQPNLWVAPQTVSLDSHDLARVAHHLDALPAVVRARVGHGPRKLYYTRLPMNCPDEVLRALAEFEANPQAGGPAVYQWFTGVVRRRAALLARVEALDRARGVPGAA